MYFDKKEQNKKIRQKINLSSTKPSSNRLCEDEVRNVGQKDTFNLARKFAQLFFLLKGY